MNGLLETLLGDAARVPAWYYIRDHGDGVMSFAGASRVTEGEHPLKLGTDRDVRFCNGEIIVRPALVVGTDIFHGYTIGQLLCNHHDTDDMLRNGEIVRDLTSANDL